MSSAQSQVAAPMTRPGGQQRKLSGSPTTPRKRSGKRIDSRFGWPWILPAMVVSVGVLYYCIGHTGYISTLDWDGASPEQTSVGAHNYTKLFADPVFWKAIEHTVVFFVATFVLQVVLGMLFAVILHSTVRLRVLYKVFIFLPVVLAPATMAPVFRQIFAPDGQFNSVLRTFGLDHFATAWLANPTTALLVIIAVQVWQSTGIVFVLYYAAMSQIQPEIMEAARLDGAGNLTVIRSIIWPGVRGTTLAIAILTAIGSLKTFDWPYLITQGGPSYGTEFLGTQIYRVSVALSQVGYGAAISIVLLVLALSTAVIFNFVGREKRS